MLGSIALTAALVGVGVACAAPLTVFEQTVNTFSTSTGFTLVANVTDLRRDLKPSINHWHLELYHTGATSNIAALNGTAGGRVWYLNGTTEELNHGVGHVLTDQGQPRVPYGLLVQNTTEFNEKSEHGVYANAGPGKTHLFFSTINSCRVPVLIDNFGSDGSFMACPRPVPYYNNEVFVTIGYAFLTCENVPGSGRKCHDNIPADCAPINFLPQCTQLKDLPAGSFSNHDFAYSQACFKDVESVNWGEACTPGAAAQNFCTLE